MSILEKLADPFTKRENERLAAQAQNAQAQLDYVYMMAGIEPLDEGEEGTDGEADADADAE